MQKNTYLHTYLQCTVVFKSDHPDEIVDLFANFCFHKGFLTNLSGKKNVVGGIIEITSL